MNVHKNARMKPLGRLQLVQRVRQEGWTVAPSSNVTRL